MSGVDTAVGDSAEDALTDLQSDVEHRSAWVAAEPAAAVRPKDHPRWVGRLAQWSACDAVAVTAGRPL